MRIFKTVVAAILLVGFASSVVAAPRLSSGLHINKACEDMDGVKICY